MHIFFFLISINEMRTNSEIKNNDLKYKDFGSITKTPTPPH